LAKCQFTTKYWDFESQKEIPYNCPDDEETLDSGLCIFHDKNYLQDKNNHKEHEQKVIREITDKVNNSIVQKKALLCVGYHLPDNIPIKGDFTKPVYFSEAKLQRIDFSFAKLAAGANFSQANFEGKANFRSAEFSGGASFFEAKFS
jgi:Pentapeptide repeats (9 copies)